VHLAESLQTAAIVLSDQSLGQTRVIIDRPADIAFVSGRKLQSQATEGYQRYAINDSGVSPMAIPGTAGCQYTADGLEHAPTGIPSSSAGDHQQQLDKRRRKLARYDYGGHWALTEGEGDIAVVTWGSCCAAVREALTALRAEGRAIRLVALRLLAPARPAEMNAALAGVRRTLIVEQSHEAQFYHYLRAYYDLPGELHSMARPGPLPIRPSDIRERLQELEAA
jgi:2-oxoglutarate ferredoxin oxidoreductase subunit alpha